MGRQPPRHLSSKRKREQVLSPSSPPASKKTRYTMPSRSYSDEPIPSIETKRDSQQGITLKEDEPGCELPSSPVFIDEGVLVGFWYADASGNGRRRVYCLVKEDFEFAYQEGKEFILIRDIDFDPLPKFGDWRGDDTEDENAMSPKRIKEWAQKMWKLRNKAENQRMTLTDLIHRELRHCHSNKYFQRQPNPWGSPLPGYSTHGPSITVITADNGSTSGAGMSTRGTDSFGRCAANGRQNGVRVSRRATGRAARRSIT
ncbi:hypothetical protein TSTA_062030 [Talaromyces stipitatus ATCC 10500]|uniref:Uncharacterized protein n=1 Tax=Talaromyces stipitatus (strain ATCC 10500 / CBS 375.48 / QM 6759 / NRRL 1006) TaxID=441959 RepID=B8LX65_TALSN|nr:uncharacterized protein TSTA_062030 [Talaromyces stipitatus ATCC 10500]EED22715.1 hypothetical protein TSTA_062030 [Talaromyces stipitatus ATCC 10500]